MFVRGLHPRLLRYRLPDGGLCVLIGHVFVCDFRIPGYVGTAFQTAGCGASVRGLHPRLLRYRLPDGLRERIQIRHFSIIDEAHHMLSFDNAPLRRLIAEGRNKGLSIILATQNMADFKSDYFDFYANAQYPLIMKQQTIADGVLKDLFGVNGNEFKELKEAISGLQKGEVILKNQDAFTLGFGKKWKKFMANRVV